MLRTIFTVGVFTLLGLFALKLLFGILGFAFGLLGVLLVLAFKIALVGGVVYLVIAVVSPETARKIRAKSSDS
jgi:hypothetical protein